MPQPPEQTQVENISRETLALTDRVLQAFQDIYRGFLDHLPELIVGLLLLLVLILLGLLIRWVLHRWVSKKAESPLLVNFLGRFGMFFFVLLGFVALLWQLDLAGVASGILAGAGVTAIVLGLAFRDIGENFLAGFFLAFGRPFNIGDTIEITGIIGFVKGLSLRHTHMRTFDGKDVFIPNGILLKNPLYNFTRDGMMRYNFTIGIDYGDDVGRAVQVIEKALEKIPGVVHKEGNRPFITINSFDASTITLEVFYWIDFFNFSESPMILKSKVMNRVLSQLITHNFRLPADIIEVKPYDN